MQNYLKPWKKYTVFTGRATRSEYWTFILTNLAIQCAAVFLLPERFRTYIVLFNFLIILPTIAVAVRRLHDTNRSGAYWFYCLFPIVGLFILLVFTLQEGTVGPNTYGPDPKSEKEQFVIGL